MPKIQQRDFYFGAALSMFFKHNQDTKPSIIEAIEDCAQIIKMTTNTSNDFYIFMKYTTKQRLLENKEKKSWLFQISQKDKEKIEKYNTNDTPIYLFFICGYNEDYKTGEIVVLTYNEYCKISHKSSVTVNKKNNSKHFNIHIGKAEKDSFPVPTNRIEEKITEIK